MTNLLVDGTKCVILIIRGGNRFSHLLWLKNLSSGVLLMAESIIDSFLDFVPCSYTVHSPRRNLYIKVFTLIIPMAVQA
jgi:hypothetical protein